MGRGVMTIVHSTAESCKMVCSCVSMGGRKGFSVPLERILPAELQKPLPGSQGISNGRRATFACLLCRF